VLATAGDAKVIRLWDLATLREFRTLAGHKKSVHSIVFSSDGARVMSAGADNTIRFWETATGRELRTCAVEENAGGLVGARMESAPVLVLSRDGKLLISGHSFLVRLWDANTGQELHRFKAPWIQLNSLSLSPDGKTLAAGSITESIVRLWQIPTGKPLLRDDAPGQGLRDVAFAPDGRSLATGCHGDEIRVWDAPTGRQLHRLGTPRRIAFTPDGKMLIGGGWEDGKIRRWDALTGE